MDRGRLGGLLEKLLALVVVESPAVACDGAEQAVRRCLRKQPALSHIAAAEARRDKLRAGDKWSGRGRVRRGRHAEHSFLEFDEILLEVFWPESSLFL